MSGAEVPTSAAIRASLRRGRWWIVAAAALAAAATIVLQLMTPTRWLSSACLELDEPGPPVAEVLLLTRSAAILEALRGDPVFGGQAGSSERGGRPAAVARILADRFAVVADPDSDRRIIVTVWDLDGERARIRLELFLAAAAAVQLQQRERDAVERMVTLEAERNRMAEFLRLAIEAGGDSDEVGAVDRELARAKIRRFADRLVELDWDLDKARTMAANPSVGWHVVEAPSAWHRPLPRRLGLPVLAALTLPLLVAALVWLVHDRPGP